MSKQVSELPVSKYKCIYVYVYMCTRVRACCEALIPPFATQQFKYVYIYIYMFTYVFVYRYTCTCVCVCICTQTHAHSRSLHSTLISDC